MRLLLITILTLALAGLALGADRDSMPDNPNAYVQPENWSAGLGGGDFVVELQRATVVYENPADFLSLIAPGFYLEDFAGVMYGDITGPSATFGPVNGYSFTTTSPGGLYSVDGAMSTNSPLDPLSIVIDGLPATAIGGDFYATDFDGNPVSEPVTVTTNDGTAVTITYPSVFAGFVSDDPITEITITTSAAGSVFVAFDNLHVGEAGTVAAEASSFSQVKALFQ
jgi:hypothetical protein